MVRKKGVLAQLEIVQEASKLFFERGYSATAPKTIADALETSTGSITYYFPSKVDLLTIIIEMLADFQWQTVQEVVDEGETPLTALCFELTAMAAMCEENEVARDLYVSAYTNFKPLESIRKSDKERAKKVFAEFCRDWTDEMYAEAELLVSGIECATLMTTADSPGLELRIAGAMDKILGIYNIPKERRKMKIDKALSLDYRSYGQNLFDNFKNYVFDLTDKSFEDWAKNRSNRLLALFWLSKRKQEGYPS